MAKAGLPEASAAITIVTTRRTIGFGIEVIALLGADSGAPRDRLLLNFAITAASEVFYRGGFVQRRFDMPRASWRGHLRLSLVSCPIYLSAAAARTKPIRLHQVWQATPPRKQASHRHSTASETSLTYARRGLIQIRSKIGRNQ